MNGKQTNVPNRQPAFNALVAETNEQTGKTYWTKIGVAFENQKGGYNIVLKANPINGKLSLLPPLAEKDQ